MIDLVSSANFTARMRILALCLMSAFLFQLGCAGSKSRMTMGGAGDASPVFANLPTQKLIVTPATGLAGKIVKVNMPGRFVVLNFPIGHLPVIDQRMNIYRLGLKVGEVRVSGPQMDDDIVADLITGEAQTGDDVRDR